VRCVDDGQVAKYRDLVDHFVAWCGNSSLILNVNKTKEINVDFRKARITPKTNSILGQEVEVVEY